MDEASRVFFADRERGKRVEFEAAYHLRVLTHHKNASVVPAGTFSDYDIIDPCTGRTMEVKADWRAADTDHFLVEFEMGGVPSGIARTTADDWVFFDGTAYVLISLAGLVDVIRERGQDSRTIRGRGDTKTKKVYRIRRRWVYGAGIVVPRSPVISGVPSMMASLPPQRTPGP